MRAFVASVLIGLGAFGLTAASPSQAQASWLSEALDNVSLQVNIGGNPYAAPVPVVNRYTAPGFVPAVASPCPVPVVAPTPVYVPAYRPLPTPVYVPAYRPVPPPAYRPVPVAPRNAYYGPNPWSYSHREHDGWYHR